MTTFVSDGHFIPFQTHFTRIIALPNGTYDLSAPLKHVKDRLALRSLIITLDDRHLLPFLQKAKELGMCSNIYHYTILSEVKQLIRI